MHLEGGEDIVQEAWCPWCPQPLWVLHALGSRIVLRCCSPHIPPRWVPTLHILPGVPHPPSHLPVTVATMATGDDTSAGLWGNSTVPPGCYCYQQTAWWLLLLTPGHEAAGHHHPGARSSSVPILARPTYVWVFFPIKNIYNTVNIYFLWFP